MNGTNDFAVGVKPEVEVATTNPKTRYSDLELQEFKKEILEKREKAMFDLNDLVSCWVNESGNGTEDTSPTFKALEEGALNHSKETNGQLALRQIKFIKNLDSALIRIENKTYGICRETGKLISKERLRVVPHATLCIQAKESTAKFRNQKN